MPLRKTASFITITCTALSLAASTTQACDNGKKKTLTVTVSAYNSLADQTWGDAAKTAWGDTLKPGMKALAVSRDLIKMGLTHKTPVRVEGFKGEYLVLDKMGKRWKRKVDIYMGTDAKAARKWGIKKRTISWCIP